MTEVDYLRGELIRARGLLAACQGIFEAGETIAPDFAGLTIVRTTRESIAEFQKRPIAVLPEGVKP